MRRGSRASIGCGLAIAGALLCTLPSAAQTSRERPEGLLLGPLIFRPYVATAWGTNDNIFRRPEQTDGSGATARNPVSESWSEIEGGVRMILPFRSSDLTLTYDGGVVEYRETDELGRERNTTAQLALNMRFASGDRLQIRETYTRELAQVETIDEGGEFVFDGQPYRHNVVQFRLDRTLPFRQGYLIEISRADVNFENREANYFDYRGFQAAYEYRQPFVSRRWLTVRYNMRRFNHYRAELPVGVPFRKEESDGLLLGVLGLLGENQTYYVRVGGQQVIYDFKDGSRPPAEFRGIVSAAGWSMTAGATTFELALGRRPLPSNFDTYFVTNQIHATLERDWLRRGSYGFDLGLSTTRYGEELIEECGDFIRRDDRIDAQAFVSWDFKSLVTLDVSAGRSNRRSNCDNRIGDFTSNYVDAALSFGWR